MGQYFKLVLSNDNNDVDVNATVKNLTSNYLTVVRQANKPCLTGFKNITFDGAVWSVIDK